MTRYRGLLAGLLLSVLPLTGCFKSDTPLISVFDSVTPVPEGRYTYVDTDKSTKSVMITHDGTVTKHDMDQGRRLCTYRKASHARARQWLLHRDGLLE